MKIYLNDDYYLIKYNQFILAIMTRKIKRSIVHYLPVFIVLISISSILEVNVL